MLFRSIFSVPLEERDSCELYQKVRDLIYTDSMPEAQTLQFKMMESLRLKKYTEAAENLNAFVEKYEIKDMNEFFLRNSALICILAKEYKLLDYIYKEAIRYHDNFSVPEKVLIELKTKQK